MTIRTPFFTVLAALVLAATTTAQDSSGQDKKYEDFSKVVAGAKQYDGLFKLHLKDQRLYAEIRPDQFEKPFLVPISIARGMGMGGHTLNFDEQWVILFKRVGEHVQVIRRNVRFQAKHNTPVARAVETTYTDSILMALPIRTINMSRMTVVIDLGQIFMTNFADLPLGNVDPNRTNWQKVKAFPKNIELQVAVTFTGGRFFGGDDSVIDPRGNTVTFNAVAGRTYFAVAGSGFDRLPGVAAGNTGAYTLRSGISGTPGTPPPPLVVDPIADLSTQQRLINLLVIQNLQKVFAQRIPPGSGILMAAITGISDANGDGFDDVSAVVVLRTGRGRVMVFQLTFDGTSPGGELIGSPVIS